MFFPLVVRDASISRNGIVDHLERHGIETRHLLPLINQPVYRDLFGDLDDACPVAARLNEDAFYIGCQPELTDDDVDYVIACFESYLR